MSPPRAELVVIGQVVTAAQPEALETVEAIGIAGGRVIGAGSREEVRDGAAPGARVVDAGDRAVIPGLHDFHVHLVGLARTRRQIGLDGAADVGEIADRVGAATSSVASDEWLTGFGWSEAQLGGVALDGLEAATGGRPTFLMSHDGHSAWASAAARRLARVDTETADPPGGRIERGADGEPTGVLREAALDLVAAVVPRLQGAELRDPLDETLRELAAYGITGATEAGDYTDANGVGADAPFGDSYSSLTDLADVVDGRVRMTLDIPADAIAVAAQRGLRTASPLAGRETMRFGWAKVYSDGALGSGTAALFAPRTCGEPGAGIMRVPGDQLDALFAAGRGAGVAMAVHAIGDRAVAEVLAAASRASPRAGGMPNDRMEHAQLVRAAEQPLFARLGVTASVQPIHAAADRDLVEACWGGRQADAYAWRGLARAGALLAAGSDAPVESVDPWLGLFSAVHRRFPDDARGDWRAEQALTFVEALSAYTLGPARGIGSAEEGHLRPGAHADLAVLSVDLATVLRADEALADVRSELTMVGGREVALP